MCLCTCICAIFGCMIKHGGPGIFSHMCDVKGRKVVKRTYMKLRFFILNYFAICWLCHARVRTDTRLSQLFRAASDEKLGGAWKQGCTIHVTTSLAGVNDETCTVAMMSLQRMCSYMYLVAMIEFTPPLGAVLLSAKRGGLQPKCTYNSRYIEIWKV